MHSKRALLAAAAGLILLLASFVSTASLAVEPELRVTMGTAFINSTDSKLVGIRYGNSWGVQGGRWLDVGKRPRDLPLYLVGTDHRWTFGSVQAGLGAVWIDRINKMNGTRANFDVNLSYRMSRDAYLEIRHFSHGKLLGIRTGADNKGWNFACLGLRF